MNMCFSLVYTQLMCTQIHSWVLTDDNWLLIFFDTSSAWGSMSRQTPSQMPMHVCSFKHPWLCSAMRAPWGVLSVWYDFSPQIYSNHNNGDNSDNPLACTSLSLVCTLRRIWSELFQHCCWLMGVRKGNPANATRPVSFLQHSGSYVRLSYKHWIIFPHLFPEAEFCSPESLIQELNCF